MVANPSYTPISVTEKEDESNLPRAVPVDMAKENGLQDTDPITSEGIPYAASAPVPSPTSFVINHVKIDEQSFSSSTTDSPTSAVPTDDTDNDKSQRNIRGAGIAAGVIGLVIGGPVLAVIGGFWAAHLARMNDAGPGTFARGIGSKTARLCDRFKRWIDGEEQHNQQPHTR